MDLELENLMPDVLHVEVFETPLDRRSSVTFVQNTRRRRHWRTAEMSWIWSRVGEAWMMQKTTAGLHSWPDRTAEIS